LTLWHIGNTTVRTPYRLKEALQALKTSEFHGNLLGKKLEQEFAELLNERSIARVERIDIGKDSSDLGRKWRSALGQLGFVVMHLKIGQKQGIDPKLEPFVRDLTDLSGRPYEITPNGRRLIHAETAAEQQECFLRALVAYRIPSIFEPRYKFPQFSPLRFVLEILLKLENIGEEPIIKFEEMVLIVQQRTPANGIDHVVSEIVNYRHERNLAKNKKKFDNKVFLESTGGEQTKVRTLYDYSDLNFRYLKATGLFHSKGRAIAIIPERHTLIELLLSEGDDFYDDITYVKTLWNGAKLPTDDKIKALDIIYNLNEQLARYGERLEIKDTKEKSLDELSKIRHQLEDHLQHFKETEFAENQSIAWEEIVEFMKAFKANKRKVVSPDGETFSIPGNEMPAYFEWTIWRAFLAVNSLANFPWEARRFKVDQDFFPLSHASAGGPDMIFEFEEYVLVVEVTLTSSSRQEAVEGEPVRRHVADIAEKFEKTDKRVYCLFIARNINSNTAETFKIGNWYKKDDTKLPLQIVPITLDDFIDLFETGFESGKLKPEKILQLLVSCRALSNRDAPEWKKEIGAEIKRLITRWE
jgi:hypothetical protein